MQAVLAARIDRLPPEEKQLLQAAAVIGTEVPLPLLEAIAELPEAALHRGLAHLQAAEFLYETRLFPERAYTFKHALTQQVAYQSLLTSTRQRYHRSLPRRWKRVPRRWRRSPNCWRITTPRPALQRRPWGTGSGPASEPCERSAYVEAISHLTKGLEVLKTLPDTAERAQHELDLQTALGPALMPPRAWRPRKWDTPTPGRGRCASRWETPRSSIPVLEGLRQFYQHGRSTRGVREIGEQLLRLAESLQDPVALVEGHLALGILLWTSAS